MIGTYTEKNFDPTKYEEFYSHHNFEPIPDRWFRDVHEVVPRFGWAYDQVEGLKPKSLLDLGSLDGSFCLTIAEHFRIPVCGVDLTKDGVKLAKQRAKTSNLPATFYQGYVEKWLKTFADGGHKFDIITWFEIIEHVEDVQKVIKLIDSCLAPGGTVLVSTPSFESPLYGADDEQNKCHVRLYTTQKKSYSKANKYGNVRKATSIYEEIGSDRIKEVAVHNHLINCRYQ